MIEKLWFLTPELILFGTVVIVSILGLSKSKTTRDISPLIVFLSLIAAAVVTPLIYADQERLATAGFLLPSLGCYVKVVVCAVGALLALTSVGLVDRNLETAIASGRVKFDPIRVTRGEYFAFFLLSLIGVMLICSATDLIWLFLALELTSLPTYVMVAIARNRRISQEAAIKYFFLGAMSAAMFLLGFAFIYGSTGSIVLTEIQSAFFRQAFFGDVNAFGIMGIILALIGLCFKIAAAPMHFYAADVYQGAASTVTAFLGFVPKTAGMLAIIILLTTLGWSNHIEGAVSLPAPIVAALFMISVLTMTLGNVLALLQRSVKRILAYSSIAHSGYMLIGILAGPGLGFNAVMFYLLAYGIMNTAVFAVLTALERNGEELDSLEDFAGIGRKHPGMAAVLCISSLSLLGFPPLLGFVGKFYVFAAGIESGLILLVVIACFNSAISAWYYLKIAGLPILAQPTPHSEAVSRVPSMWPRLAGVIGAVAILVLWIFSDQISEKSAGAFDNGSVAGESAQIIESDSLNITM